MDGRIPRRRALVRAAALVLALATALLTATATAAQATHSPLRVGELTVGDLSDPLGVEAARPKLAWRLTASRLDRGQRQTAYQVRVASSPERLARGHADVWDSGKVRSARTHGVAYDGPALGSRDRRHWQVRVWDARGRASGWSKPASWEMGLLSPADWQASWIGNGTWDAYTGDLEPVTLELPRQTARYVRLDVTRLGLPIKEGWPDPVSRLQLAEIEVADSAAPDDNLARGAAVTATDVYHAPGAWEPRFVTDGKRDSNAAPHGFTSLHHFEQDLDGSIWIQLDLGTAREFDRIRLYPRTDHKTADGRVPNFPADFTVQVGDAPDGPFTTAATYDDLSEPSVAQQPEALPLFAKQFAVQRRRVERARLYVTGLGLYEATINGKAISDAVLEPGNTDFREHVVYAAEDVTRLLRAGDNAIGLRVGTGIYDTSTYDGRYAKFRDRIGPPKALAQLEITYADGTRETVATDPSWKTTLGPTTHSNWYGGEDYDARREPAGWDTAAADLSVWETATTADPPAQDGEPARLVTRAGPAVEPVDVIVPKAITEPRPGVYVFDLGVNIAGWQRLQVSGPAGTRITMRPSELLHADGTVDQGQTGSPIYDNYTLSGEGIEVWRPHFVYHGFRYLQVEGLPQAPTVETVQGIVLRAANRSAGHFDSSNQLIDDIHRIIDRAVQGNMYHVLTDCPHREKLGWLEETHLVFDTVARNYEVGAYGRDLVAAMADAQLENGLVPDIAPEYTVFSGGFRDDPNWGSAIVLVPWNLYRTYGDADVLATYYSNMVRYVDYLGTRATGNLLDYGLGDWGTINDTTPAGVTATYGYYKAADGLAKIAAVLGKPGDAERYAQLARAIGQAFHARYHDAANHTYANGTQAADALALDMGETVPAAERQAVVDHLVDKVESNGNHLNIGEIGLGAIFRVLSDAGRDDVIYRIANQTTQPSYGAMLARGATSLTEFWDGSGSHNHFMLGAIDVWFTSGLVGIKQAPDSVAYEQLVIDPAVVGDLQAAEGSYETPQGTVRSAWRRDRRGYRLDVSVPVGATATVHVRARSANAVVEGLLPVPVRWARGVEVVGYADGEAILRVGAGDYRFRALV